MVQAYRGRPKTAGKVAEAAEAPTTGTRDSLPVKAARAATLLDNRDLRAVFDQAREELISDIELCKLDGSPEAADTALENIRQLQALLQIKRIILRPLVAEQTARK